MENEIVRVEETTAIVQSNQRSAFMLLKEKAKLLADSDIVPKEYQGKPHNCIIAIEMAERLGMPAMQVMQSLHIIHGRPSWSSTFLIATVNACGRFTPLRFQMRKNEQGEGIACRAIATDKASGDVLEGPVVTLDMAREEGWATKSGSKWKTMPELMLRYRAASFWARLNAPEISMGLHTEEEVFDAESKNKALPIVLKKAEAGQ